MYLEINETANESVLPSTSEDVDGLNVTSTTSSAGDARVTSAATSNNATIELDACASLSALTFDYDAPSLKSVMPSLSPRWGGRNVTLFGSNFGPNDEGNAEVSIDGAGTTAAVWQSDKEVSCSVPAGDGQNLHVKISVGEQESATRSIARSQRDFWFQS
jgi:hypothetical protein